MENQYCVIWPDWRKMLHGFLGTAVMAWSVFAFAIPSGQLFPQLCLLPIALAYLFGFLRAGIHYSVHPKYLMMRFLGIPVRKIPWLRVTTATYLHKWMDHRVRLYHYHRGASFLRDITYGRMIYVTLDLCPDYWPMHQSRLLFSLRHPFTTCTIWIPYQQLQQVEDLFTRYCILFEKQPMDKL